MGTQNNGGNIGTEPKKSQPVDIPKHDQNQSRPRNPAPAPHPIRSHHTPPPPPPPRQHPHQEDDIQEIMPLVKSEPSHVAEAPIQPLVQQGIPMYDESAQQVGSNMMMSMDTEQYGDGDNYGDHEGQDGVGTDGSKVQCQYCEKWIHKGTITRHVKHQHQETSSVACPYCNSLYKNQASLSNHLRIKHCFYK